MSLSLGMITLCENLTKQLNEHEAMFVSMAMQRFHQLIEKLNTGEMDLNIDWCTYWLNIQMYTTFFESFSCLA